MNSCDRNFNVKNYSKSPFCLNQKVKKQRQSLPNFIFQELSLQTSNTDSRLIQKPHKLIRPPRMSENWNQISQDQINPNPHIFNADSPNHKKFQSPVSMKKPIYICKQEKSLSKLIDKQAPVKSITQSPKLMTQIKSKSQVNIHKQTLRKIQQKLINYGVKLNVSKTPKHPHQNSTDKKNQVSDKKLLQYIPRVAQNETSRIQNNGNKIDPILQNIEQESQKQLQNLYLKQSISTISSNNNNTLKVKISDFHIGRQLGKGKFGVVKMVRHKKTGMMFSLKIIKKSLIISQQIIDQFIKQVKIQAYLNHPNIVKLYSIFDDEKNIYLLLELCTQGNLYEIIKKNKKVELTQAKSIIKYMCEGVSELHHFNIIHRDIKPENIVLCFNMAKIIDFGWSTQNRDSMRQTFCGTPLYVSPELLSGNRYNQKVDLWAIGILSYQILTGKLPFQITTERDLYKILNSKIVYPNTLDSKCVAFIESLLIRDPSKRKSINQILGHSFFKNN